MKLGYGAPFLVRGSMFPCRHVWLLHPCTISFKSRGHKLSNLPRLRQTKVGKAKKLVLKNRKNPAKPPKLSKIGFWYLLCTQISHRSHNINPKSWYFLNLEVIIYIKEKKHHLKIASRLLEMTSGKLQKSIWRLFPIWTTLLHN